MGPSLTFSIAPEILPPPQLIPTPSNAGPAAVDVTIIPSLFPTTISPLVPKSTISTL